MAGSSSAHHQGQIIHPGGIQNRQWNGRTVLWKGLCNMAEPGLGPRELSKHTFLAELLPQVPEDTGKQIAEHEVRTVVARTTANSCLNYFGPPLNLNQVQSRISERESETHWEAPARAGRESS